MEYYGTNYNYRTVKINKCCNLGTIQGKMEFIGGIAGSVGHIYNSYNVGNVSGSGIVARYWSCISNCYNFGETSKAGIATPMYALKDETITNVYTINKVKGTKPIRESGSWCALGENVFYPTSLGNFDTAEGTAIEDMLMKSDGSNDTENEKALITLLNEYVTKYNNQNKENEEFIELCNWIIDPDTGYPIINF